MTLSPHDDRRVYARADLPAYPLNERCPVPGCTERAAHDHHIWRRSLGKGYRESWYVELGDGYLVPNRVKLCAHHHRDVDGGIGGHSARIRLEKAARPVFFWEVATDDGQWFRVGVLPMPVGVLQGPPLGKWFQVSSPASVERGAVEGDGRLSSPAESATGDGAVPASSTSMQTTIDGGEVPHDDVVHAHPDTEKCPRCKGTGKVEPKPKREKQPSRPKATWSVRVPKDEREDGYALLTERVDDARLKCIELGLLEDNNDGGNYYALIYGLDYFAIHAKPEEDA